MIHFITPLYRYNNIEIIYSTIKNQVKEFNWHLIEGNNMIGCSDLTFLKEDDRVKFYKIETEFIWGHEQRNYFIENITADDNDWCYFLDDDNVVTPDLIEAYNKFNNSDKHLVLFSQKKGLTDIDRLFGDEENLRMGGCDVGSFLLRYNLLKKTKFNNPERRNDDGHFSDTLSTLKDTHNFVYLPNKFVRYNALSLIIT